MGNQNKPSLARKRLSTLAVTTTLAAVGVGVVGTGAANAATTSGVAHSQDGTTPATTASAAKLKSVMVGTGADYNKVDVDLTGTQIDPTAVTPGHTPSITLDWGVTGGTPKTIAFDATTGVPATADLQQHNTYAAAGSYKITVTVDDGSGKTPLTDIKDITIQAPAAKAPTLAAAVSSKTVAYGGSVTVNLTGSSVDASTDATKAVTTISWGDKSDNTVLTGDPSKILATNSKLTHAYAAAGTYHLTVDLVDSKGTKATEVAYDIVVSPKGAVQVNRAAGADRYATGLIISQHAWADNGKAATDTAKRQQAKAVVLATGNAFPDALAGVPLAKKVTGPLLLTDGKATTTNADVLAEIQRVVPKGSTVYVLGGEAAISAGIEKQLNDLGFTVNRLAGADRFGTALKIAKDGMGDPSHIILARGDEGTNHNGFADALAAGPYAANVFGGGDSAVVLSNNTTMDAATNAYVQSKLHVGAKNVAAIGGQAVSAIKSIPGSDGLYAPAAGANRYETAAMVASAFLPSGAADKVGLATGLKFPDALTGGAYMASVGGPLLLTDPSALSDYTSVALGAVKATAPEVDIFGGTAAVSDDVAKAVAKLLNVATIGKF